MQHISISATADEHRHDSPKTRSTWQPSTLSPTVQPHIKGKFLYAGDKKFFIRGVTYGPFNPELHGCEYHTPELVERDFRQMRQIGINTVRTYTVPPGWLLELAQMYGLFVMVGLPWEQHIAFMEDEEQVTTIERRVRDGVRACAQHSSVLCYTIGNEIPPSIVRWYGRDKISSFLKRLYRIVKQEDTEALVTYVNFPTTEYLHLPFLDFLSFNVYLEDQNELEKYLSHLQHLAGNQPLVLAEVGLDSRRNGVDEQAHVLDWQIRSIFNGGCAGTVVFSWTDEWYRGGHEITDWDFGLTTRDRSPKPALNAVEVAYREIPEKPDESWPRVSVVICSYNGSATMQETLEHATQLQYPNYEIIVVDDGSMDQTSEIARSFPVQIIRTENRGLSSARNTGLEAASGEIVAYLDDDAYPDPDWLTYLVSAFRKNDYVGVGGPNIPPEGDGFMADCIGKSPGGPSHVLVSNEVAEHIPGCNMAFRREALQAIDGFDEQFRIAGDDVDLCWRLQEAGGTLGFHPGAVVWHHPRSSLNGFWRQQRNYGRAEAMLELKWPSKYNVLGHSRWSGRVYANGDYGGALWQRWRVYYGQWGKALFQPLYAPSQGILNSLPQMPEWYLLVGIFGMLSVLGVFVSGLEYLLPVFLLSIGLPVVHAGRYASRKLSVDAGSRSSHLKRFWTITFLYCTQPIARLVGRLQEGLVPWRQFRIINTTFAVPRTQQITLWSEDWEAEESRLESLEHLLKRECAAVKRGGDFDRWDLEVRAGLFGSSRLLMAAEEHGDGRQLVRMKTWPRPTLIGGVLLAVTGGSAGLLALLSSWPATVSLIVLAAAVAAGVTRDCGNATAIYQETVQRINGEPIS